MKRIEKPLALLRKPQATYVDTSVWCAYCFNESGSEGAIAWMAEADTENVGTSWWTQVEFASALGIQVRKKALNKAQSARAHKRFEDVLDMVNRLNVVEQDFLEAMAYCEDVNTGLRGGDALHLAVAQRHGCTRLATLDTQMQANARRLGLDIVKF